MFDDADLRELGVELGPGRHTVLERLVDLRALDVDEDQGVDGGEDGEQVLILAEVTAYSSRSGHMETMGVMKTRIGYKVLCVQVLCPVDILY